GRGNHVGAKRRNKATGKLDKIYRLSRPGALPAGARAKCRNKAIGNLEKVRGYCLIGRIFQEGLRWRRESPKDGTWRAPGMRVKSRGRGRHGREECGASATGAVSLLLDAQSRH